MHGSLGSSAGAAREAPNCLLDLFPPFSTASNPHPPHSDRHLVQCAFGSADEQDVCNYDVDCDGQINPVDAGIVQSLFGTCEEPRDVCP